MPVTPPNTLDETAALLGCLPESVPRSVAIIMDGNGRWARQRGLARSAGHEAGARNVNPIVTRAAQLGLEALTLFGFSTENWNRPATEVQLLMTLFAATLRRERPIMVENNIRFRHIGRRRDLPEAVLRELDGTADATAANDGMFLCLALNYGSRAEITDAVRAIALDVAKGRLDPLDIDEATLACSLSTAGVPDPDLFIRTSGEMRLSNFLLWQISYAELYVTDVAWPDFTVDELRKALGAHARRQRRYGTVPQCR